MSKRITSPDDPNLQELCKLLAVRATELDRNEAWPAEQLALCGEYGVFEWFIGKEWGGQAWSTEQVVRGYLALSAACLTTTFIITQLTGACRRIEGSDNTQQKETWLPKLAAGERFATVGISHLTTSRRHLATPVLRAFPTDTGFRLDGYSPWVTGAAHADAVVVGATLMEGEEPTQQQLLAVVPTDLPGISTPEPFKMVGVTGSCTGPLALDNVEIPQANILAGPRENVMRKGTGASTGGFETSTLALGLASAAIAYMEEEASKRPDLEVPLEALQQELESLTADLMTIAIGDPVCTNDELRRSANSLVLRASQSALTTAKGTGYVIGHPTGRWCREALFFLVWSCPQSVLAANLCELAGVES